MMLPYMLVQDDDCHWYVIRCDQEDEFNRWEKAVGNDESWHGRDFNEDAINGPHNVTFGFHHLFDKPIGTDPVAVLQRFVKWVEEHAPVGINHVSGFNSIVREAKRCIKERSEP